MDPIKSSIFNPVKITPILSKKPTAEKLQEVTDKVKSLLSANGYATPNVKDYKASGNIIVWVNEKNSADIEKITNLLKENGAVPTKGRSLELDSVDISVAINSKKSAY